VSLVGTGCRNRGLLRLAGRAARSTVTPFSIVLGDRSAADLRVTVCANAPIVAIARVAAANAARLPNLFASIRSRSISSTPRPTKQRQRAAGLPLRHREAFRQAIAGRGPRRQAAWSPPAAPHAGPHRQPAPSRAGNRRTMAAMTAPPQHRPPRRHDCAAKCLVARAAYDRVEPAADRLVIRSRRKLRNAPLRHSVFRRGRRTLGMRPSPAQTFDGGYSRSRAAASGSGSVSVLNWGCSATQRTERTSTSLSTPSSRSNPPNSRTERVA